MSRIGKQPITIPASVSIKTDDSSLTIKGPKGELKQSYPVEVSFKQVDNQLVVSRADDSQVARAYHGLFRSLVANSIVGVVDGFVKSTRD